MANELNLTDYVRMEEVGLFRPNGAPFNNAIAVHTKVGDGSGDYFDVTYGLDLDEATKLRDWLDELVKRRTA